MLLLVFYWGHVCGGSRFLYCCYAGSLGTGTIFAFPGSVFGGLVVGYFYKIGKKDYAAFTEPLGTALIGGTLSALLFAPVINAEGSIWFFIYLFALSSVPGGIIGYFFVKLIRNVLPNINWEEL